MYALQYWYDTMVKTFCGAVCYSIVYAGYTINDDFKFNESVERFSQIVKIKKSSVTCTR